MLKISKLILIFLCIPVPLFSHTIDNLGLGGTYKCYGYDMHDGGYDNAIATLSVDDQNSEFSNNFGAYHFKLAEPDGTIYLGEVAASGNQAAIYFSNTSPKMNTDNGVGIASITHDRNENGQFTTVIHKFYYEPNYHGGGNGSETCTKIDYTNQSNLNLNSES